MASIYYPAIVERGIDSYGVYFPDLPGCVSAGNTLQEAALGAEEALNGHLSVAAEYGDAIPDPSDLDAVIAADGSVEVGRILVRGERAGRAVRVQVSIEEGLLARIDRVASNRSRFLADAARAHLRDGTAPAITGQGELATMNRADLEREYGLKPRKPARELPAVTKSIIDAADAAANFSR